VLEEIRAFVDAIELRDIYTKGHSQRVAQYAKEFAQHLQLEKKKQEELYIAGVLHDLGKVGIPDQVLLKPSQLDEEEFKLIQYHSTLSGQIVEKIPSFAYLAPIVKAHHENWDGSGYPDGLAGEAIPFEARILSLCDVFDALTTPRIYRQALPLQVAIDIIKKQRNKFDPDLLEKFLSFIKKRGIIKQELESLEKEILSKLRENVFFHDYLTKLLNREGLLAIIRKSSDNDRLYGSLVRINIKKFREYNKKFGLKKGDWLLKEIAKFFQNFFKASIYDFFPKEESFYLGRVGADNFILFYIGHKVEFLKVKLERVKEEVHKKFQIQIDYEFLLEHAHLAKSIKHIGYIL